MAVLQSCGRLLTRAPCAVNLRPFSYEVGQSSFAEQIIGSQTFGGFPSAKRTDAPLSQREFATSYVADGWSITT